MQKPNRVYIVRHEIVEMAVTVQAANGTKNLQIPSNFRHKYRFLTIDNTTNLMLTLQGSTGILKTIGRHCVKTFPLPNEALEGLALGFVDPDNGATVKRVSLYFSVENLNFNCDFTQSFV